MEGKAILELEEVATNVKGPVLVTGASTGIGRCIAETLAGNGYLVYATARKKSDIQSLAAIKNIEPMKLDVTKQADVDRAVEEVRRRGKGLFGLVNVAGIGDIWPLCELEDEGLRRVFEVNVFGVHRVTRAMLPFLAEARGRIINISSIGGLIAYGMRGGYSMSKWSIESYSECLNQELERHGIRVSVVEPAYFRTKANEAATKLAMDRARSAKPVIMKTEIQDLVRDLPRISENWQKRNTPEKVAAAVLALLRSEKPRSRCLVSTTKEQFLEPIDALIGRAVDINVDDEFSLSQAEMHSVLDRMWDKTRTHT